MYHCTAPFLFWREMKVLLVFYIFPCTWILWGNHIIILLPFSDLINAFYSCFLKLSKTGIRSVFFLPEMLVDAKCAMHFIISEGSFWAGLKVSSSQAYLHISTLSVRQFVYSWIQSAHLHILVGTSGCKLLATFVAPTINLRENKAKTCVLPSLLIARYVEQTLRDHESA